VRVLQRENAQLHLKVKGLTSELEELRALREKESLELESVNRTQSKRLTEHGSNLKALEVRVLAHIPLSHFLVHFIDVKYKFCYNI
jgi:hypothetical protein